MTDRAIPDDDGDVQTGLETAQPSRTPFVSPRELALQAMDEARARDFTQETGVKVEVPPLPAADEDEDVNPDDAAAELARAQLEGREPHQQRTVPVEEVRTVKDEPPDEDELQRQVQSEVIADVAGKKVRVKIDGVEQEVNLEDVVRNYQKGGTADKRLEEATRLLREAKSLRATETPPAEPVQEPPERTAAEVAKEITSAFFSGDEEKAQQLLAEALAGQPSARTQITIDNVEQIAAQVTQQLEVQGALTAFQADYPKIWNTPRYAKWANELIADKESEGMSRAEAIRAAGAELAQDLGMKPEQTGRRTGEDASTVRAERLSRKVQATERLPVRSVAPPSGVEDAEPASASATIG